MRENPEDPGLGPKQAPACAGVNQALQFLFHLSEPLGEVVLPLTKLGKPVLIEGIQPVPRLFSSPAHPGDNLPILHADEDVVVSLCLPQDGENLDAFFSHLCINSRSPIPPASQGLRPSASSLRRGRPATPDPSADHRRRSALSFFYVLDGLLRFGGEEGADGVSFWGIG